MASPLGLLCVLGCLKLAVHKAAERTSPLRVQEIADGVYSQTRTPEAGRRASVNNFVNKSPLRFAAGTAMLMARDEQLASKYRR